MPTINWVFLCDYAFVDVAGKASIIGTFENMNFHRLPSKWAQFYVALKLMADPNDQFNLGVVVSSPSGDEIKRIDAPNIRTGGKKAILTFGFYNTEFTETGEHHIELLLDDTSIHVMPFTIKIVKPQKR
jgi:hypothetical protein